MTKVYDETPEPRMSLLVTLGLAWLAIVLWFAHASIMANGVRLAVTQAAIALPTVIAASVLAGGTAGLAAVVLLARRGVGSARRGAALVDRWPARLAVAVGAGLLTGGLAGGAILVTYGATGSMAALAASVAVAGAVGGVFGAPGLRIIPAAGLAAALSVFVVVLVLNLFHSRLMPLFGAADTPASIHSATVWFGLTQRLLGGLTAGLVAFVHLRRTTASLRWPAYLAAGATPGVLLLLADLVTRVGGRRLLELAAAQSRLDSASFGEGASARLSHALFVLFLGAIVAMVAFGRTLPRAAQETSLSSSDTSYHSSS